MSFKLAFFSDTHLGYATRCRVNPKNGINMRVWDGFVGLKNTVDDILNNDVDVVLHGGDFFHRSNPGITEIVYARQQLARFAERNIPVITNTGNHDFANERGRMSATAALRTPKHVSDVHEPVKLFSPETGITIHVVSHIGLLGKERPDLQPDPNDINIFTSHGAAQIPGHEMFACVDSPGEAVIGYDVLSMPWNVTLLGHYHKMDPLPGFNTGDTGQAWYAGSLLRRGFSDPEGGRGWLLVTIEPDGQVNIERKFVKQRPQHDLPTIDAANLTPNDVEEKIVENLTAVDVNGAILRQKVVNIPAATRRNINTTHINSVTEPALTWQLEYTRPPRDEEYAPLPEEHASIESLTTAKTSDLPVMWDGWVNEWADQEKIPETVRTPVAEHGRTYLEKTAPQEAEQQ